MNDAGIDERPAAAGIPLAMAKVGERSRVLRISGQEATRKHLGELGFVPGAIVSVVMAMDGNLIIAIHDSRIAVNRDVSRHVHVELL